MFRESKTQNVFDEMYYARAQSISNLYTTTSFANLKMARVIRNTQINVNEEHASKLMQESYLETALQENAELTLFFSGDKKEFKITGILNYSTDIDWSDRLRIIYKYQLGGKKLIREIEIVSGEYGDADYRTSDPKKVKQFMERHGLTEKDIAYYRNYFLYEKLLSDWFEHNPNSLFSKLIKS